MKRVGLIALLIVFFFLGRAQSYTVESVPQPKKENRYVINPDGILSQAAEDGINAKINSFVAEKKTSTVAVCVVNSIGNDVPDEFANRLYGKWGIGKEKTDVGVLLLMVKDQKKVVIRTGYGAEGALTDYESKEIIENDILPRFRNGDFDGGISAGVDGIISEIKDEKRSEIYQSKTDWKSIIPYAVAVYLLFTLLCWFWVQNGVKNVLQNKHYNTNITRYKAIKQATTAITAMFVWLFPIVGFIAFLLVGKLIYVLFLLPVPLTAIPAYIYGRAQARKARFAPILCNTCQHEMHLLSEKEEDKYLSISQQFEEQLNAVNYDVFVCDNCKNEAIFADDKFSKYALCPKCNTKSYILTEKNTIVAPTYFSSGTEKLTYKCKFCGYEENENNKLPRLTRSTGAFVGGAAAGNIFSGSGGFSGGDGGGFSGGFGGGMTGGGGASGGW